MPSIDLPGFAGWVRVVFSLRCFLSLLATITHLISVQSNLRADQLTIIQGALQSSYCRLVAISVEGSSNTKIDAPNIPPQIDSFVFFFKGPVYQLRKEIGGFEFIQSYNGEYSQAFEGKRSRLEIINNPRLDYFVTLPYLQALEWLLDEDQSSLRCHDLLSKSLWAKRFLDARVVVPEIQKQGVVLVEFPNGKGLGGVYQVRFLESLNFAVGGWEYLENGKVAKSLEVIDHTEIPELKCYLPSSVSLKAAGVVASSTIKVTGINEQVSDEQVVDLRPRAKQIYDEFEIMKHVEEVRRDEELLIQQPSNGLGRWFFLALTTFAIIAYLTSRLIREKLWRRKVES